ncbi:protein kinase [Streptomyces sp. NPDC088729]|uniref:protein kinase n=1 Tax=Streptomyces sp. NPDC088729 TaxID=3365876 RepID=UPI00382DD32C
MDDYAGRVLADRYRLPLPPSDGYELVETRAFDTYSGQEVLVRQVPLPEIVDAEVLDADGRPAASGRAAGRAVRRSTDPAVRRAIEAAQAAAQVPDHPRLDQVFDVFAEAGSLWIVSELVAARPLAALLAERPLNPYRAAEIGSDVLMALRVLHAHGWTHRNITVRTVLVCDDGRVMLTGLAAGAAEEALCGYAPEPLPDDEPSPAPPTTDGIPVADETPYEASYAAPNPYAPPNPYAAPSPYEAPYEAQPAVDERDDALALPPVDSHEGREGRDGRAGRELAGVPLPQGYVPRPAAAPESFRAPDAQSGQGGQELVPRPAAPAVPYAGAPQPPAEPGAASAAQLRAARAGAIAAYRAGARAAARVAEDRQQPSGAPADLTKNAPHPGPGPHPGGEQPAVDAAGDGAGSDADTGVLPVQRPPAPLPATGPRPSGPWRGPAVEPYDDEDDEDDEEGPRPPGRRVHLAGTWDDGPGSGRPVPAGGSGADALRADSRRPGATAAPVPVVRGSGLPAERGAGGAWEEAVGGGRTAARYRGPATPLAAERARQARIAVVGPVTERWAPEQAGPVHENWQLAPPIGPSTDLWALGALLYRAVQGHAPYPEENAAELVQMVCAEPPAFAEECGALRPVVESLLRQDPTERPDFEELRGWLRSLVRSAPEPEAGADVVPLPSADATRLPIVRRRGELVRRRRGRFGGGTDRGRHRQGRQRGQAETRRGPQRAEQRQEQWQEQAGWDSVLPPEPAVRIPADEWEDRPARAPRAPKGPRALREPARRPDGSSPRRLGRTLLIVIMLLMAAAIAYALMFMPKQDADGGAGAQVRPSGSAPSAGPGGESEPPAPPSAGTTGEPGSQKPQTSRSAVALASGYALRKDAEGFEVGVPKDWQRSPANADRQIRYGGDGFSLLVVPGRDSVKAGGSDPLDYQRDKEPELQPFRDSSWSTSSGLRRVDVGRQAMAEGQFTWQDANGREVFVRNLAMIVDGRYHIVQAIGPVDERDRVTEIYEQAIASYRVND